jgi:putative alpha-1,2-mannosidase
MKIKYLLAALPLLGLVLSAAGKNQWSDYVHPFVGAQGENNTYLGPTAPFGMIQISPDTDTTNWDTDSGYGYTDPRSKVSA